MPNALFVSPHLDDAVFSCGGTLYRLAAAGWGITVATVFTASVPGPRGFALRCQTDKGLAPEVDYMALRRAEDRAAAGCLGLPADGPLHWPFREAPHRGYESAAALFAGARADDAIWEAVADRLRPLVVETGPDLVFAPQGLGNHVDHLQVIRAVLAVAPSLAGRTVWYRDTPYALREPGASVAPDLPAGLREVAVDVSGEPLARKVAASRAYTTQVGFQFGGAEAVEHKLETFHRTEAKLVARWLPPHATHVERLLAPPHGPAWPDSLLMIKPSPHDEPN